MKGLAANDAAERDCAVVRPPGRLRRVEGDRHAGGNLERASHAHEIVGRAGGFERAGRAGEQAGADRVVVARLDDEESGRPRCEAQMRRPGAARPWVKSLEGWLWNSVSP